jgi:uncharacterized protein
MALRVSKLWIHPVKGCRAIEVDAVELDELGLVGDRRFLVIDSQGKALTQRSHSQMARIETQLDSETLALMHPGNGELSVPRQEDGARNVRVEVWKDRNLVAEDCGPEAAAWLSRVLELPVRLVRIGHGFRRPVEGNETDLTAFTDAYPLLVITEASLSHLNDRLISRGEEPVSMMRFRPNLVITGATSHAEDEWQQLMLDDVVLQPTTACARCTVVTIDQFTGERSQEPLRTLASYRRDPSNLHHVNFGRNVINVSKSGRISVGQTVVVI